MKEHLKKTIRGIFIILATPLLLLYWLGNSLSKNDNLFAAFSQILSLIPGKSGSYFRCAFYRFVMTRCDADCVISFATVFSQIDTELEAGVYIGAQCNIGTCKIEKNSLLGSGVHIISGKKQHFFDDLNIPIRDQGGIYEKIVIGEDTWIGNGALILSNVGKKCVIAAGSVVINDVPDYSAMAGNPATLVKHRQSKTSASIP